MSNIIKLFLGPYEANGIIRHRTQRLCGVIECLNKEGFYAELIPTAHLDRLTVEFMDREIFRCNVRNFEFNLHSKEDQLCRRLLKVVKEHAERFLAVSNIPHYVSVNEGLRIVQRSKIMKTCDFLSCSDVSLIFEVERKPSIMCIRQEDDFFAEAESNISDPSSMCIGVDRNCIPQRSLDDYLQVSSSAGSNIFSRMRSKERLRKASIMFKSKEIQPIDRLDEEVTRVMEAVSREVAVARLAEEQNVDQVTSLIMEG